MAKELSKEIEQALTELAQKRLLGYAYKQARSRDWPGECDLLELAQDAVSEAICRTLTGERKWNQYNSILDHLFSTVKSIVDAKNKHSSNKLKLAPSETPEAALKPSTDESGQDRLEADEFFIGVLLEIGDDEVCAQMLDRYEKGFSPQEIGEDLGLCEEELRAATKRLKRKVNAYRDRLQRTDK